MAEETPTNPTKPRITALVTGASSGIGKALAIELSRRNIRVFACARSLGKMEDLKQGDFGQNISIHKLDVTSLESVRALHATIKEELKVSGEKLDVLFNNAGQSCSFPAIDVTDEEIRDVFEVNVFGVMRMCREFAELLIEAQGKIVITGSLAGVAPFPWGSVYSSTKAAVHQYAKVLRVEMKPFKVQVSCIITGGVDTNIADPRPMKESSLYYVVPEAKSIIKSRTTMAKDNKPVSAEKYAKKVCDDIDVENKRIKIWAWIPWFDFGFNKLYFWEGSHVFLFKYLAPLVPYWILEAAIMKKFKVNKLSASMREHFEKQKRN